jgi:hypothetical protein
MIVLSGRPAALLSGSLQADAAQVLRLLRIPPLPLRPPPLRDRGAVSLLAPLVTLLMLCLGLHRSTVSSSRRLPGDWVNHQYANSSPTNQPNLAGKVQNPRDLLSLSNPGICLDLITAHPQAFAPARGQIHGQPIILTAKRCYPRHFFPFSPISNDDLDPNQYVPVI